MTKENKLKIGLAINHIAMAVPKGTLDRISPWLNQIEDIVLKEPTEVETDGQKRSD